MNMSAVVDCRPERCLLCTRLNFKLPAPPPPSQVSSEVIESNPILVMNVRIAEYVFVCGKCGHRTIL
jgi:hypothetical protein